MTNCQNLSANLAVALMLLTFSNLSMAEDEISAQEFIDQASAAGMAEIQTANLALEKAQSVEVKNFAKKIISDHTNLNEELKRLAKKKALPLADEASMMDRVKEKALETREGESFDEGYANNQVSAHEEAVELFRNAAANIQDKDLNMFAKTKVPILEQHLKMARDLAKKYED